MPQKINISSKKTQKNKNGDALKIYNLRYYRAFLTEKWLCYNQNVKIVKNIEKIKTEKSGPDIHILHLIDTPTVDT